MLDEVAVAYTKLNNTNKSSEIDKRLETIWATADVQITSSRIK